MISAQQLVSLDPQVQQLLQALQAEHAAQLRVKDALIAQRVNGYWFPRKSGGDNQPAVFTH